MSSRAVMQRAVVFGAGGLLGRHLVEELRRSGGVREVVHWDRAAVDIAAASAEVLAGAVDGADHVFNTAAYTDVDGAEREPAAAFRANALGAENVARAAAGVGATVIHVSTDFVFDGALGRPYDEFDVPGPVSTYARSKRAGEILVERANSRHHVVRVQGLYGDGGRSFSSRLRLLLRDGKKGLRLDCERRVQPTWARAAARALIDIALTDRHGTWHASCRGATTWHEFALLLATRLGVAPSWEPVPTAALALPASRPANCLLETRRLDLYGMPPLPAWDDALAQYLTETKG